MTCIELWEILVLYGCYSLPVHMYSCCVLYTIVIMCVSGHAHVHGYGCPLHVDNTHVHVHTCGWMGDTLGYTVQCGSI